MKDKDDEAFDTLVELANSLKTQLHVEREVAIKTQARIDLLTTLEFRVRGEVSRLVRQAPK